ncbi:MAG: hypothetical protein P4M10_03910, partial [Verrucomicrobiae bacterium]|nr:hypothetical protein [Verrucomicrobiae bacterium]
MKLENNFRTLVSAVGAVICLACTAPASTVLVSFSRTNAAVRPSSGVYYNSATVASAAQTAAGVVPINGRLSPMSLTDVTNASTGWTLTLTKANSSGAVVAGKSITQWPFTYNPPAYPPTVISFPVNALQYNIDVSLGAVLLVTVSNLNPQLTYNLLAYGASASTQLNGFYSLVTGTSFSPATVNFDSYANRTVTPTWTNINPSADGKIAFTITSPNSVVALNFMELSDSGAWETLVDGASFTNAQAFINQWYYNYPWGTIHNGSALMNPTNVTVTNGVVTLTSSLTNAYEGTSMSPWNIPIAYNSGTFFLQQEMVISRQSPVWDISADFIVPSVYGTWPAMWLLGANQWPPESDILEVKGSSVIWQNTYDGNWQTQLTDVPTAGNVWHNYRVLATMLDSTNVDFKYFIDGVLTSHQQASTFVGVPCELIIDFQMGGAGGSPGPTYSTYTYARNIVVKREELFGGSLGGGVLPDSNVPYQEDWGTTNGGNKVAVPADVGWNQALSPDFYSGFFQYTNRDDETGAGLPANSMWCGDSDAGPNLALFYTTNGAGSGICGDSAFASIDPALFTNLEFSVYAQWGWNGGALQSWFAVQVEGAWYVSTNHPIVPNQAGGDHYHRTDMAYSPAATNWNELTVGPTVVIGGSVATDLSGPITGIGLVAESTGGWWNINELQVALVATAPTTL